MAASRTVISDGYRVRAPGGVRFACWMIGIGAALMCVIGALLLFVEPDAALLQRLDVGRGVFQVVGFVLLGVGLLEFVLIYALSDGSRVARIIVTVLVGLSLVGGLGRAAAGIGGIADVIQIILQIAILIGLWATPDATEFFAKQERPATIPPPPV